MVSVKEAVKRVDFARSKDRKETRSLKWVMVSPNMASASDGKRAAIYPHNEAPLPGEPEMFREVCAWIDGDLRSFCEMNMPTPYLIEKLVPLTVQWVTLPREALLRALKAAKDVEHTDRTMNRPVKDAKKPHKPVVFTFHPNHLAVSVPGAYGQVFQEWEYCIRTKVEYASYFNVPPVGMELAHILDAVRNLKGDDVCISFQEQHPECCSFLVESSQDTLKNILMPRSPNA